MVDYFAILSEAINGGQGSAQARAETYGIARAALRKELTRHYSRRRPIRKSEVGLEPSLFLCLQFRFVFRDKRANFSRHIEQL